MQFNKKEKQRAAKKKELSEIKGWFKGRKKKELQEEIDDLTSQIRRYERLSSEGLYRKSAIEVYRNF